MKELLQRELIVVAGKGGVGKTTITAAIGLLASRAGQVTAMAEMTGAESLSGTFGIDNIGYSGRELQPGLHAFSISAQQAVEEYLLRHIRFRRLYDLVFGNRFIAPFMNAVLGLSDLISLGKVMDLGWEVDEDGRRLYELLVLDAPATGHGLTMLRAPRAMMELAGKGPLFNNARLVDELISDEKRAALVLVTLPEEMPVNETLELAQQVTDAKLIHLAAVVVNGVPVKPLADDEEAIYRAIAAGPGSRAGGQVGRALGEVERMLVRRRRAEGEIARLRDALPVPLVEVPLLPTRKMGLKPLGEICRYLEGLP